MTGDKFKESRPDVEVVPLFSLWATLSGASLLPEITYSFLEEMPSVTKDFNTGETFFFYPS